MPRRGLEEGAGGQRRFRRCLTTRKKTSSAAEAVLHLRTPPFLYSYAAPVPRFYCRLLRHPLRCH
jgi:hypothetical protein